jgi:hypothetical protein
VTTLFWLRYPFLLLLVAGVSLLVYLTVARDA